MGLGTRRLRQDAIVVSGLGGTSDVYVMRRASSTSKCLRHSKLASVFAASFTIEEGGRRVQWVAYPGATCSTTLVALVVRERIVP